MDQRNKGRARGWLNPRVALVAIAITGAGMMLAPTQAKADKIEVQIGPIGWLFRSGHPHFHRPPHRHRHHAHYRGHYSHGRIYSHRGNGRDLGRKRVIHPRHDEHKGRGRGRGRS